MVVALSLGVPSGMYAQKKTHTLTESMDRIQKKTITGTVLDEEGEPLPGATVTIEGTSDITASDIDGNFTILCHSKKPRLVITYVGMKPVTLDLEKEKSGYVRVRMEAAPNMMSEVVVTGYQNIKRENATGSYQVLTAADLDKRTVSDLSDNLEGKIPGMMKKTKSSSKDEDAFIIRGQGTFNAKTAPLVVVDGLPIEGGMSTVNPYDIENVTVLKDAAAASIYGARAANGVIVITTKAAKTERLSVDFNADLTITEKQKYDNMSWANAAQVIELEKYNFQAMLDEEGQTHLNSALSTFNNGRLEGFSPVMRQFLANHTGQLSDDDLNATLDRWSRNDYRREYQDVHDRNQVFQQYNVAVRAQGKIISSSLMANYSHDNMGIQKEKSNSLTLKYRGDIKAAKWLDVSVGLNVLNTRSKTHDFGYMNNYAEINSFLPYQSMYNEDGSLARMEGCVYPGLDAFSNPDLELKDNTFNLVDEMNRNFRNNRYTNTRAFINTKFTLLPGWTASAQFQYEDIFSESKTHYEADSYIMRSAYNAFTTGGVTGVWVPDPDFDLMDLIMHPENYPEDQWFHLNEKYEIQHLPTEHHIPDGGFLSTSTGESKYYTFRAQTNYKRTLFGKHDIDLLGGFEYRETRDTGSSGIYYGYDEATQNNNNYAADWSYIQNPVNGVFGDHVTQQFLSPQGSFGTYNTLHRFYSIYFTGNYVFDNRYSISGSYRVDKCDLFGTDPKFRGRPLWSIGGSWNAHNEAFLRPFTWINALKLRGSYGLTGNIDQTAKSRLTASIKNNPYTNESMGDLQTPPNDQLRWEKTATWNLGVDFAFLGYRVNGSLDYYHKKGTDILTKTDIDHTAGYESLILNSGDMVNHGIEFQLDLRILQQRSRRDLGVNLGFNIAYNKNKVIKASTYATSGADYLGFALKEGYPLNSLFSYDYAGLVEKNGQYVNAWRDHNGEVHDTPISNASFTQEDAIYCGTATPTISGSLTPEITWNGFSLSAMFNFYGGHKMRVNGNDWYTGGGEGGYDNTAEVIPVEALKYWKGEQGVPGNGINSDNYRLSYISYRNDNIVNADYMKLRNIVLSYNFDRRLCRKIGLNDLRLRVQMNNVCTWARNSRGIDPEAWSGGKPALKTPRSYTMSIFFNL